MIALQSFVACLGILLDSARVDGIYTGSPTTYHVAREGILGNVVEVISSDDKVLRRYILPPETMVAGVDSGGHLVVESTPPFRRLGPGRSLDVPEAIWSKVAGSWALRIAGRGVALQNRWSLVAAFPGVDSLKAIGLNRRGSVAWISKPDEDWSISFAQAPRHEVITRVLRGGSWGTITHDGYPFIPCEFVGEQEIVAILRLALVADKVPQLSTSDRGNILYICRISLSDGSVTPVAALPNPTTGGDIALGITHLIAVLDSENVRLLWNGRIWPIKIR